MRGLVVLALLVGCVPKKRMDEALADADRTRKELAVSEAAFQSARAHADRLEAQLAASKEENASLDALTEKLQGTNKSQADQLVELAQRVAALSATNTADKAKKAELEAMLGALQEQASAAESDAAQAREKAAALAAERERLAAEAARLAEEKAKLERKTAEYDALVGSLEQEIASGQVTITELSGKLTVNVSNAILFDSGATAVKPEGKAALTKVAGVLAAVADREIRVEGHTDDVPVRAGASYPDNWALSALRASTVVGILVAGGVDPLNIAAVGYGEHHPAGPNDTAANRAINRRTEIVLVPKLGAIPE